MKKKLLVGLAVGMMMAGVAGTASATSITSSSDAALSGGSVINFDAVSIGSYTSLVLDGVTFAAQDHNFYLTSDHSGQYNMTGLHIENTETGFSSIRFSFNSLVSAFGFNLGASNVNWNLSAYDATDNLLGGEFLPIITDNNNGEFYGLAFNDGISYAILSNTSNRDWIMIDNFTTAAPVPVPATMLLMGSGIAGLIAARRKKKA
jgi:hypothetical protein